MTTTEQPSSSYLQYLPAIFHEDPFVGRFLRAFEAVFSGPGVAGQPGLEEAVTGLVRYIDPESTPEEFLPWLASWVALSLRADWDSRTKRDFIAEVVPLYRLRGTRAGLERMLEIYTREKVTVDDTFDDPPHYFQVRLTLSEADQARLRAKQEIARAIIDQEKPAHTFYGLKLSIPTMRILSVDKQAEVTTEDYHPPLLIVGKTTLLGT
jgi:phage tail-like protein